MSLLPRFMVIALFGLSHIAAHAADPSAIWHIDHDKCVPHMQEAHDPSPCATVDLNDGYVILKDRDGATQYLLMPTARISGIEDPAVLAPGVTNFWDRAWRARTLTEDRAGKPLPRDALSLAINSPYGRTQDQLHIHIDCVRPDVREALGAHRDSVGPRWAAFPVTLAGQPWRAIRVDGENFAAVDPFQLLAKGDPPAAADMEKHTLVAVGMTWSDGVPGFVVLDGTLDLLAGDRASGEILQDHDCALAR